MKIRIIIIILALLAFLTASGGGYFYYHSMRENLFMDARKYADAHMDEMADRVTLYLSGYQKMLASLAGQEELKQALGRKQPAELRKANAGLDLFQHALEVDACYLLDRSGKVIASSNRNAPKSFVGKNYFSRPYFKQAMRGDSSVYPALDMETGKRRVFYGHPVYAAGQKVPAGVVVIEASMDYIEKEMNKKYDGVMMLVDPGGIIFVSSRSDWLYRPLWKTSSETLSSIAATRQFGAGPFEWTGMKEIDDSHAVDSAGNRYVIHHAPIFSRQGWELVYLHDLGLVSKQTSGLLLKKFGYLIVLFCAVVGATSIFLYRKANIEILKRKRAEEGLQSAGDRLQAMIKASPLPITIIDAEGTAALWNPAAEHVFGWSEREILGRPLNILPDGGQDEYAALLEGVLKGKSFKAVETRRMKKDGALIDVAVSTAPLHDAQGTVIAAMAIYEDITERKKAEKAEENIRFLGSIIQNLPDAVCAIDTSGTTIAWNKGAEKMLGYKAEEIIGKPITTVIPEEIAGKEFEHCLTILNADGFMSGYESVRLAKDGKRVPVELTAVVIRDKTQKIINYASIMMDVTDRKKAEEERMKLHMLESVGILAGGIAHDFNNLLCAIIGNIEVAKMSAQASDPKAYMRLEEAEKGCEKARELSQRLITFATGGEPLRKVTPIAGLITETVVAELKESPVIPTIDLQDDLYSVAVDEGQMRQVFNNLVLNAKTAMPDGGTLDVRGKNVGISAKDNLPLPDGNYLKISISDTGSGIPAENLTKIFDPYFSTRDAYNQKGLGLGLAVCYSVINRHSGLITVESKPGTGTTFHIYLPAVYQAERSLL